MDNDILEVTLIEKELVNVELLKKELINIGLNVIDILQDRGYLIQAIKDYYKHNVVPNKITNKKFSLPESYVSGSLSVYLNGLKEKQIIEESSTEFSFKIDTITTDDIEVSYIKQ